MKKIQIIKLLNDRLSDDVDLIKVSLDYLSNGNIKASIEEIISMDEDEEINAQSVKEESDVKLNVNVVVNVDEVEEKSNETINIDAQVTAEIADDGEATSESIDPILQQEIDAVTGAADATGSANSWWENGKSTENASAAPTVGQPFPDTQAEQETSQEPANTNDAVEWMRRNRG